VAKQTLTFSSWAYEKNIIEVIPSQNYRVVKEDRQDPLIDWQLQREMEILVVILLVSIIMVVGILSRRVKQALLIAFFFTGIIIVLLFSLLGK
jgi:K+-sensing histidine kinase KdpD